jgi:hypothetical protein
VSDGATLSDHASRAQHRTTSIVTNGKTPPYRPQRPNHRCDSRQASLRTNKTRPFNNCRHFQVSAYEELKRHHWYRSTQDIQANISSTAPRDGHRHKWTATPYQPHWPNHRCRHAPLGNKQLQSFSLSHRFQVSTLRIGGITIGTGRRSLRRRIQCAPPCTTPLQLSTERDSKRFNRPSTSEPVRDVNASLCW